MKKIFWFLVMSLMVAVGFVLGSVISANAQEVQIDSGRVASMAAAAHEVGGVDNTKEISSLQKAKAEFARAKRDLEEEIKSIKSAKSSMLRQVAIFKGLEKSMPKSIKAEMQEYIDDGVKAAIAQKGGGDVETALKTMQEVIDREIAGLNSRIKTLESEMRVVKADIVDIKERVGVNLAPQFQTVFGREGAMFQFGARLLVPAKKTGWELGLEAGVGTTHKKEFGWGVGFDAMKRIARYFSVGPSVNFDAIDTFKEPGVDALGVTGGVRADFHVGPVDFTAGGGLGYAGRSGHKGLGWRAVLGLSVRCF